MAVLSPEEEVIRAARRVAATPAANISATKDPERMAERLEAYGELRRALTDYDAHRKEVSS